MVGPPTISIEPSKLTSSIKPELPCALNWEMDTWAAIGLLVTTFPTTYIGLSGASISKDQPQSWVTTYRYFIATERSSCVRGDEIFPGYPCRGKFHLKVLGDDYIPPVHADGTTCIERSVCCGCTIFIHVSFIIGRHERCKYPSIAPS